MTDKELFEEVASLRLLVDSLCVALIEKRTDNTEEIVRLSLITLASSHGSCLWRNGCGQYALDRLEEQKQILLEDYPNLKESND